MKKRIFGILLIAVMIIVLTGCGSTESSKSNEGKTNNNTQKESSEKITLDNIKGKVEALGIIVEADEPYYQMVGAEAGLKLHSGDYRVEIYKFNKSSDAYKNAEKNQKLSLGDDMDFDAVVKNGYAYLIDDEFPSHDEVVALLEKLS